MPRHKSLKSVAHNFGYSFISLMNDINGNYFMEHLFRQARKTNISKLTIDVLNNCAEPEELLTMEIKSSIDDWCMWFPKFVEDCGSTIAFISSATMIVEVDLQHVIPRTESKSGYPESPFTCEVTIIDDRGKVYQYKHEEAWF